MNACFIASGGLETASARMRAWWVAPHMDATVVTIQDLQNGKNLPETDWYIWQKTTSLEVMAGLLERGKGQAWDICDPSWWWQPKQCREISNYASVIVASNQGLADDFAEWRGLEIVTIPDRIDLSHYGATRIHDNRRGEPVKFIWYGYGCNRYSLFGVMPYLERLTANGVKLTLTVMDDNPGNILDELDFPIYHTRWSYEREIEVIASHDIALLPTYPGAWGGVKSNNRHVTAWACGIPSTTGEDWGELWRLATLTDERIRVAKINLDLVKQSYQVDKSALEWMELLR